MTVRFYESTDSSAPILTGELSTFINLLDKCLVTGYGVKTAAGWTKPYTNGNTSVFKCSAGNQFYLQVNDGLTGDENFARVQGFESMSDYNVGTGSFPTNVQLADGYVFKSTTKNSVARPWFIVATESTVYVFINSDSSSNYVNANFFVFGDFQSYAAVDNFASIILVETVLSSLVSNKNSQYYNNIATPTAGHYLTRSFTQIGNSITSSKFYDDSKHGMNYPNPVDGSLYMSRIYIGENVNVNLRGHLKGLWRIVHPGSNFSHSDEFSGVGDLSGKSFKIVKNYNNVALAVEVSNTW